MQHSSNTLFIGKVLLEYDALDSTNEAALDLIKKEGNIAEGTVLSTSFQKAGRGQRGNIWESEAEQNILLSIILKPKFLQAKRQFILNQISSLAILDVLYQNNIDYATVKWPNDVYVEDQKIAGILIQNILKASSIEHAIIGIGFNINQVFFSDKIPNPTSFRNVTGRSIKLSIIKQQLFAALEKRYLQAQNQLLSITDEYKESLYAINQIRNYFDVKRNKKILGAIKGLDETGKLLVESEGALWKYDFKEIQFL